MKSSRLIAALLLSAMLFTAAACSDDSGKSQQSGETTAAAETTEAAETEIPDNLPASDFEGYEFTIMTYQPKTYYMETETGDILDDAKYARQLAIQERFNVKFGVSEYKTYVELTPAFQNSVLAGDNACDIAVPHLIGCCPGFINGHFVGDWNMTDYIDFSKPWWNQQLNDTMLINDRLFYIAGYVTLPSPMCMFYNKAYGDDYSFEDMNTVIREGRW
nr:hypothetical protein [Clostridia bacterium]